MTSHLLPARCALARPALSWLSLRGIRSLLLLSMIVMSAVGAETNAPPGEGILQQELKQKQIRATTQRVAEQLGAIIAEFERNAIGGEDVKVLQAIRGVLGQLIEKEMEEVVRLLQQARQSTDPSASTKTATDAYA